MSEPNKPETKAEAPAKPSVPEPFVAAEESRFATSAEFVSPLTSYVPAAGTPPEHLLRPGYWASIKALRSRCRIWIEEESGAYVGELYVLKTGQGYAVTQWLPGYPMRIAAVPAMPSTPDGYVIEYRGHIVKHRVVRTKDNQVLKQGLDNYDDAAMWLRDHKRMLAA